MFLFVLIANLLLIYLCFLHQETISFIYYEYLLLQIFLPPLPVYSLVSSVNFINNYDTISLLIRQCTTFAVALFNSGGVQLGRNIHPLNSIYPFVFMDAIHYKVKENHQYVTKAAYVVLGINMDGCKDILGIWIGEHEGAKFWLNVLNNLKNRGVQSVYVFCVNGLTGFREAISSVYPKAQIQCCIIHQIRSSTKFASYKDIKKLMSDLKTVYQAINEDEALNNLMKFKETWGKTYPSCVKSWEENWDILSTFFAYPAEVRRIIYTTNIIEGLNRQFRSITKTKPSFTNDDSLRKMLYLASKKIIKYGTARC